MTDPTPTSAPLTAAADCAAYLIASSDCGVYLTLGNAVTCPALSYQVGVLNPGYDPAGLDNDNDGLGCESNAARPATPAPTTVPAPAPTTPPISPPQVASNSVAVATTTAPAPAPVAQTVTSSAAIAAHAATTPATAQASDYGFGAQLPTAAVAAATEPAPATKKTPGVQLAHTGVEHLFLTGLGLLLLGAGIMTSAVARRES